MILDPSKYVQMFNVCNDYFRHILLFFVVELEAYNFYLSKTDIAKVLCNSRYIMAQQSLWHKISVGSVRIKGLTYIMRNIE